MEIQALVNDVERAPIGILLLAALFGAVWLIGLTIVLRDTRPSDRAQIIRAYGIAFPWRRHPGAADQVEAIRRERAGAPPPA